MISVLGLLLFIGCGPSDFNSKHNVGGSDDNGSATEKENNTTIDLRDYLAKESMERVYVETIESVKTDIYREMPLVEPSNQKTILETVTVDGDDISYDDNDTDETSDSIGGIDLYKYDSDNPENRYVTIGKVYRTVVIPADGYDINVNCKIVEKLSKISFRNQTYKGNIIHNECIAISDKISIDDKFFKANGKVNLYFLKNIGKIIRTINTTMSDINCLDDNTITDKNTCSKYEYGENYYLNN